jgi:DHA1 family bicyclomycin/chloramphenicol resistance-like MFS transporter
MLVIGLAPILAPLLGAQLLHFTSWRGVFVGLAIISSLIAVAAAVGLRETLPAERRSGGGLGDTLRAMRRLLRDRTFLGHGLAAGFVFGTLFAYISGSSFVLQDLYGLSPQLYGVAFAANGLGLVASSQVNARLVERFGPSLLLRRALMTVAVGALTLLAVVSVGGLGVWAVLVPMFVIVSSLPFVMPNAMAIALAEHADVAGTASALLGLIQFLIGAIAAPLVGAGGTTTAVPMAIVMVAMAIGALAALRAAGPRRRRRMMVIR